MRCYEIPSATGISKHSIEAGDIVFIAGQNGAGKSSLLHTVARSSGSAADLEIFSGHRQIHFQSNDVEQTGLSIEDLRQQMHNIESSSNRFRSNWAEQHLKSVVKRIHNLHSQQNEDIVNSLANIKPRINITLDLHLRILPTINRIFEQADLSFRIIFEKGGLHACSYSGAIYGIDRLSDGERAALLLVGAILIQPIKGVIAIDEPEKHLNPQISCRLIAAAYRARPDLYYFIASHELRLIEELHPKTVLYISKIEFNVNGDIERGLFVVHILNDGDDIPEDVKVKVLGSRKPLLFIEGDPSSYDYRFYKYLYPDRTIVPRGGWESVAAAVRSLIASDKYHWVHPVGLIDRDGKNNNEIAVLANDKIFTLPTPTIENLFFHPLIVREMAKRSYAMYGGKTASQRFHLAAVEALSLLKKEAGSIIARKVTWKANRILSARKISVKDVNSGKQSIDGIELGPLIVEAKAELDRSLSFCRPFRACFFEPIKNTSIPNSVVSAIGFNNFNQYRDAVLQAMEADPRVGKKIIRALKRILPSIS